MADAILTFDLNQQPKRIIVEDNLDYGAQGWDINDVVAVITFTGTEGVIYENTDFNSPDIVPATSLLMTTVVPLPLDPLTDYTEVLKGNYTLKVTWYNSVLDEEYEFLDTYQYDFELPVIANVAVSGPYSGTLTSTDTTVYGSNVYQLTREHRIKYPTQLPGPPADIVSSNAEIVVTPIYTNKWTIEITSSVEYSNPDELRILWDGYGEFFECVYGSCISAMYDAINTMLIGYYEDLACQSYNQEAYQKRLVIVNTAWHLLNIAYIAGDVDEADAQSYVIQEQVEWTGSGTCDGTTSILVIPCPPYSGGGGSGDYVFENGLTQSGSPIPLVHLGGTLIEATTIGVGAFDLIVAGTGGGNVVSNRVSAATGVTSTHSDGTNEGRVYVAADKVTLERADLGTPANTRGYEIVAAGIVEKADYTAGYGARNLVAKSYVDDTFLLKAAGSFHAYPAKGTPIGADIVLIEDSADGYAKKEVLLSNLISASTFISLTDTIDNYTNQANFALVVNATADAVASYDLTQTYIHTTTAGQINGLTGKATPVGADVILIEDSEDSFNKKQIPLSAIPSASQTYLDLTDTDNDYTGFGGYLLQVKGTEDGIEFATSSGWVPVTGGSFTGVVSFVTSNDRPIILKQTGTGGTPGIPQGGNNYISFQDGDGDEQGFMGIDSSGNIYLKTSVTGQKVYVDNSLFVNGDGAVTGSLAVGKSTATSVLDVEGDVKIIYSGANPSLSITNDSASDTLYLIKTTSQGTDRFNITSSGIGFLEKQLGIGIETSISKLHVYQNDTTTDATTGITIEQDGTGDAALQYLLTGGQRWVVGIDNSDGDKYKIASSADLNTDARITIDPSSGYFGIGKDPSSQLDVNGDVSIKGKGMLKTGTRSGDVHVFIGDYDGYAFDSIGLYVDNEEALTLYGGHRAGFGIIDPNYNIHAYQDTNGSVYVAAENISTGGSALAGTIYKNATSEFKSYIAGVNYSIESSYADTVVISTDATGGIVLQGDEIKMENTAGDIVFRMKDDSLVVGSDWANLGYDLGVVKNSGTGATWAGVQNLAGNGTARLEASVQGAGYTWLEHYGYVGGEQPFTLLFGSHDVRIFTQSKIMLENTFNNPIITIENDLLKLQGIPEDAFTLPALVWDSSTGQVRWRNVAAGSAGEANTASNVGSGAGLIYKQKVGVNLELKTLLAGAGVTITNNTSDITITAVSSAVTWGDITGKPTTIAGYAITNAYTKTETDGRYVRKDVYTEDNSFSGDYLVWNYSGSSNVDYIAYNDTSNTFFFSADASIGNTIANANVQASSFVKQGGTSSQFLKANGTVDSNTYLTSYSETDTLSSVVARGNSTSSSISVGAITGTSFLNLTSNGSYVNMRSSAGDIRSLFIENGGRLLYSGVVVAMFPSTISGGSPNSSGSTTHTHAISLTPNYVIFPFDLEAISGTYNWDVLAKPNIRDATIGSGTVTINVTSTGTSGMSGMCRFTSGASATTLVLKYNGFTTGVWVDVGAKLTLDPSTKYFLTFVNSDGTYIFNLAKYV
jgi:hypothetical protein